ncbi:hypothetical protein HRbin09_01899 [bacterium HR09]|nr:hypothetical protein HRbin09_01899 [bacterium HR09]
MLAAHGQGNVQELYSVGFDDAFQLANAAKHRPLPHLAAGAAVFVHKTHHVQAQLPVLGKLFRHGFGQLPGADDHRPLAPVGRSPNFAHGVPKEKPPQGHEDHIEPGKDGQG